MVLVGCLDLDLVMVTGFTDESNLPAAVVVAAASSSPADLSPMVAVVVLVGFVVGAMNGRAAFSDPRPPAVSCSFSLRFSLRACDFE